MRNFLILSAIVIAFTFSCNNSSKEGKPAVLKSDTTLSLAYYKNMYNEQVNVGVIKRVVRDSFMYLYVDTSLNNERRWTKDTSYITPADIPVDSLKSKQYKIPIKDSTGKQNYITYWIPTHKRFVRSGWNGVDSVLINGLKNQQ